MEISEFTLWKIVDLPQKRIYLLTWKLNFCFLGKHFQCTSGLVIPSELYCDSRQDCNDGSDEPEGCQPNQKCRPDQFECNLTKICLSKGKT